MTGARSLGRVLLVSLAATLGACATRTPPPPANTAPRFPAFEAPDVPASLRVTPAIRDQHELAWRRLQAGDLRGAEREFAAVLKRTPGFYPAEAGLGYAHLADEEFKQAVTRFSAALAVNDGYLPALSGLATAHLELGNDLEAIGAMDRVIAIDPSRESVRTRLELLRFRQVQSLIEEGRRARQSNRLDEGQALLERALTLSPTSAVILRELALVELQRGSLDAAEGHARGAVKLDPFDAETHASLGAVLEARGQPTDAAAAYARAAAIDSRYRDRVERLLTSVKKEEVPAEFRDLPGAATVTRAQLAALVGTRLEGVIDRAPSRVTAVATDVRNHWAAAWIVRVTQAGVMEISPNHTFQPASTVRRGDLARVVSQLLTLGAANRPELPKWRAARPKFADLPSTNLFYAPAALAVAAGVMASADDRFQALRPVTGAEVIAAVARLEQLVSR